MNNDNQTKLQEDEYKRPYHHLINLSPFSLYDYLSWGLIYYSYVSEVVEKIDYSSYGSVAEVGCGDGKITIELAKKYPKNQFVGYDISDRAIQYAKAFGGQYKNLAFHTDDFLTVEGTFDAIVCVETLEHIPDEEIPGFVSSLRKRTKKRLIVSVPTTNVSLNPKHFRHYDLELLKKHLVGFELIDHKFIYRNNWLSWLLAQILANRLFITRTQHIIRPVLRIHNKFCRYGSNTEGWHIVASFRPV
ncbi:MAG: class I SAM-dependent methyltransferase [Patescibacteria group bacterium]